MDRILKLITPFRILAFIALLFFIEISINFSSVYDYEPLVIVVPLFAFIIFVLVDVILSFAFKGFPKRNFIVQGLIVLILVVWFLYK